jgi:hypothetical protein
MLQLAFARGRLHCITLPTLPRNIRCSVLALRLPFCQCLPSNACCHLAMWYHFVWQKTPRPAIMCGTGYNNDNNKKNPGCNLEKPCHATPCARKAERVCALHTSKLQPWAPATRLDRRRSISLCRQLAKLILILLPDESKDQKAGYCTPSSPPTKLRVEANGRSASVDDSCGHARQGPTPIFCPGLTSDLHVWTPTRQRRTTRHEGEYYGPPRLR